MTRRGLGVFYCRLISFCSFVSSCENFSRFALTLETKRLRKHIRGYVIYILFACRIRLLLFLGSRDGGSFLF